MDMFVMGVFALIMGLISIVITIIKKKRIWRILLIFAITTIIGLPVGYLLTPEIIAFF